MFSTLLMGGGEHTREKDHQNVKSLVIFAHDCRGHFRPFGKRVVSTPRKGRFNSKGSFDSMEGSK